MYVKIGTYYCVSLVYIQIQISSKSDRTISKDMKVKDIESKEGDKVNLL